MRTLFVAAILTAPLVFAAPVPRAVTLQGMLETAAKDLEALPADDREHTRYLVFWPDKDALDRRRVKRWWISQLSTERGWHPPLELEGGKLWRLDLRDYRWTPDAWNAVAERDPYLWTPLVPDKLAQRLRQGIYYEDAAFDKLAKKDKFPCIAVLRADWLFRETIESQRSPAYYDLLFARQRHGKARGVAKTEQPAKAQAQPAPEPGSLEDVRAQAKAEGKTLIVFAGQRPPAGVSDLFGALVIYVPTTGYDWGKPIIAAELPSGTRVGWDHGTPIAAIAAGVRERGGFNGKAQRQPADAGQPRAKQEAKKARKEADARVSSDFPKDEDDWNDAFGIKATNDFLAKQEINLAVGAVVAGSLDDPNRGSIVSRNNRLLWFIRVPTGAAFKTFDVSDTGKDDLLETSPELPAGKIPFEASEYLAHLPNGGMASFLTNKARKRIERGDIDVVHNKVDSRFADVRNPMGCVVCHTPEGGFIQPRNLVEDLLKAGVDVKIKDREKRNLYRAFFLEMDDAYQALRTPYERLIERTTAEPGQKGMKPAEVVAAYVKWRDDYDDPLNLRQCAYELGCEVDKLKLALTKSPLARLNGLVQGLSIPRRVWETSLHQEATRLVYLEK